MKRLTLIGERFNKLLAICRDTNLNGKTRWKCICDCGNELSVKTAFLRNGDTKSCGCLSIEKPNRLKHGHNRKGKRTKTYRVWSGIIVRCTNKNHRDYKWYGGRGITVCERWKSFENFLEDMGESKDGFDIDRINSNYGYEKNNCQWISHSENTKKSAFERWGNHKNEKK